MADVAKQRVNSGPADARARARRQIAEMEREIAEMARQGYEPSAWYWARFDRACAERDTLILVED